MAFPVLITDLSTTANSNGPAGTDIPTGGDDYIRVLSAFIASLVSGAGNGYTSPYIISSQGLTRNLPCNGYRLTGLISPTAGDEPATKTYADGLAFATTLPSQVDNVGKEITTDGTTAFWGLSAASSLAVITFMST